MRIGGGGIKNGHFEDNQLYYNVLICKITRKSPVKSAYSFPYRKNSTKLPQNISSRCCKIFLTSILSQHHDVISLSLRRKNRVVIPAFARLFKITHQRRCVGHYLSPALRYFPNMDLSATKAPYCKVFRL